MEFTKIEGEEVSIPAHEAKVFDKLWIKNLRIISTPETGSKVIANLIPFNGEETIEEPITPLVIEDIFTAIQDEDRPAELRALMAQVMEGIFQVCNGEIAYQKAKKEAIIEEEIEAIIEENDTNNTQPE